MRCTNPEVGIKVLSYDLLDAAERDELDAHLTMCAACRDLKEQTFGDQGAFQELEYRAFRLSQRQVVQAREWWPSRLRALALPISAILLLVLAIVVYLARRPPDTPGLRAFWPSPCSSARAGIFWAAVCQNWSRRGATRPFLRTSPARSCS